MLSEKFIKKYMRLAKQFGEDNNPCYSRKIGVIIVDSTINKIVATGYNGPPRGTPHCDSKDHLLNIVWPQLTEDEKTKLPDPIVGKDDFVNKYADCKTCPRKLIKAESGKRLELCSCAHAEVNAIVNASQNIYGCTMFCWCPVPCIECTKIVINAGIKELHCFKEPQDYSIGSRYLFEKAGVNILEYNKEDFI
jgi:dCMP deaminase